MKHPIFTIFLFIIFCSSCHKDDYVCTGGCLIFEGIVFDPNNSVPVTNCDVTLTHQEEIFFMYFATIVGQVRTDENGFFSIRMDGAKYKNDDGYFVLKAEKEEYLNNEGDGELTFYTIDSTSFDLPINSDVTLLPKAKVVVRFESSLTEPITSLSYWYKYSDTPHWIDVKNVTQPNSQHVFYTAGNQPSRFGYIYTKNGLVKNISDSIFIKSGASDTLNYQLY